MKFLTNIIPDEYIHHNTIVGYFAFKCSRYYGAFHLDETGKRGPTPMEITSTTISNK